MLIWNDNDCAERLSNKSVVQPTFAQIMSTTDGRVARMLQADSSFVQKGFDSNDDA